MISTTRF